MTERVTCLSLHRKSDRKLETKVHLDPNQFALITIGPLESEPSHVTSDSSAREEMVTLNHQPMAKNSVFFHFNIFLLFFLHRAIFVPFETAPADETSFTLKRKPAAMEISCISVFLTVMSKDP